MADMGLLKGALEDCLKQADVGGLDQTQQREQRKKVDRRLKALWPKLEASLPPAPANMGSAASTTAGGGGSSSTAAHELVVMCGECAVKVHDTEIAVTCINTLLQRLPPLGRDPLQVRALCVQAWAKASLGTHLLSVEGVNHTLKAVAYILQALDLAVLPEVRSAAPYLVYNISVYYWNIVRPMFRESAFRHLVPSMTRVVDALESTNDRDRRWRIQYLSTLAMALDDASQTAQGATRANLAAQYAREVLEGEKAKAAADSAALSVIHKEMDSVRVKIRQVDKALEAVYSRSENRRLSDEVRASALEEIPRLTEQAKGIKETELADKEKLLRDAETRLEASVKVQKEATALVESLLVQRLCMGRRGDSDGKKLVETVKAEANKDGGLRLKTLLAVQGIKTGVLGAAEAEKELPPLLAQAKAAAATADGLEALTDIGLAAARVGNTTMALETLDLVLKAKTQAPVVRVKVDYLKCILMSTESWLPDKGPAAKTNERLDERHRQALSMARRSEAVRTLERALMACKRLSNSLGLFHDGCFLAWNLCLPLLQPHLRKQTQRLLQFAAVELERLDSPCYHLRALIHTELGKLELASDLLANATTEVNKALTFDYSEVGGGPAAVPSGGKQQQQANNNTDPAVAAAAVVVNPPADSSPAWCEPPPAKAPQPTPQEEAENEKLRPLDRFLLPLQLKLSLKSSIYHVSEDRADKALVLLEQAREIKDPEVRSRTLDRASLLLRTLDKASIALIVSSEEAAAAAAATAGTEPDSFIPSYLTKYTSVDADGSGHPEEAPPPRRKRLASLWYTMAELAWEIRDVDMLHQAALRVLDDIWHPQRYKDLFTQQAKTQYMLAESLVEIVLDEGTDLEPLAPDHDYDPLLLGVTFPDLDPRQVELKKAVITTIVGGIRRAAKTGDAYLVENGCVYLWNYHLPAIRKRLDKVIMPELLSALEVAVSLLKEVKSQDTALLTSMAESLSLAYEGRGETAKVLEVCNANIPAGRPYQAKGMVMALARASNGKVVVPSSASASGGKEGGKKSGGNATGSSAHPDARLLDALASLTAVGLTTTSEKEREEALTKATSFMEEDKKGYASRPLPTTAEEFDEGLELRAELWSRLAAEQLRRGANRRVQAACESCLQLLPNQPHDLAAALRPRLLRWLSVSDCLWGRSVAAMVDPLNQDKALQDQLRVHALGLFVEAARYGSKAKMQGLVLDAAKQLWTVSLPLHVTAVSRCDIFPHVLKMLTHLTDAKVTKAGGLSLRARLYALSFQCYADERRWEEGLRYVTDAFNHVPAAHAKPLWQWKVVFMSKMGKPVLDGIAKMKEADPVLQARVWAALAKSSSQAKQQMEAYLKIFAILSERFERTEYYVEAAEWLVSQGFERAKAMSLLQAAVDTVLEVEVDNADEEAIEEGKSQASRSQESSKLSSKGGGGRGGEGGGGSLLRRSSARSRGSMKSSRRSGRGPGSVRSSRSPRSAATRSVKGGGSSKPGTSAINPDGTPMQLGSKHYELLIRALAMQAQLTGKAEERRDRCVQACAYAGGMVTALIHALNTAARMDALAKLSKDDQATTSLDAVAVDPSKLFAPATTHTSICLLALTPTLLDAARRLGSDRRLRHHAISPRSFHKSPVSLYHLTWLAETLTCYGLDVHAGVCLTLAHLIAELALSTPSPFLILLARTRRARLLTTLGQTEAAVSLLSSTSSSPQLPPLGLDNVMVQQNLGDVEDRERQLHARRKAGRPAPPRSANDDMLTNGFETRHLWAALAEEAVYLGQQRAALEYLTAAGRHNHAYEDDKNQAYCSRIKAMMEVAQGKSNLAVNHLLLSLEKQGSTGDAVAWGRGAGLVADLLVKMDDEGEADKVLSRACSVLLAKATGAASVEHVMAGLTTSLVGSGGTGSVVVSQASQGADSNAAQQSSASTTAGQGPAQPAEKQQEASNLDAVVAWAQCSIKLADLHAQRVLRQVRKTKSLAPASGLSDPFNRFQTVEKRLVRLVKGFHPIIIDVLLQQAKTAMQAYQTLAWLQGQVVGAEDLLNVRALYAKALRLLSEMQANALPPRPLLTEAVMPAGFVGFSLPVSRRLAEVQAEMASIDTLLAKAFKEHTSKAVEERERAAITDAAERWLLETAPKGDPTPQSLAVKYSEEAIALASSSSSLLSQLKLPVASLAEMVVGTGHLVISMGEGKLDDVWSTTPIVAPPPPPQPVLGTKSPAVAKAPASKEAAAPPPQPAAASTDKAAAQQEPTDALSSSELELKQAMEDGVVTENWEAVGSAAAALLELYGSCRCKEAVASLLHYQSCRIRPFLLQTFLSAAEDTDRQAIFIRQVMKQQQQDSSSNNAITLEATKTAAVQYLNDQCFAWRRLDCSAKAGDLMDKLPPNLWVLSLQMDAARTFLYAGGTGAGGMVSTVARAPWRENERSQLLELQRRMAQLRKEMTKHMLLYGDEAGAYGDLCPPEGGSASAPPTGNNNSSNKAGRSNEAAAAAAANNNLHNNGGAPITIPSYADHLETELHHLIKRTEALLGPVLHSAEITSFLTAAASVPKASVVLLLDQDLLPLPMEGLLAIRALPSVSRDFSIHILSHRVATAREVNGKDALEVKNADMAFLADPRVEDAGSTTKDFTRATVMQTVEELKTTKGYATAWKGVMGKERTPAVWEWQAAVGKRTGGGFLYYGPSRTLAHFPPKSLAGLHAKGCQVCLLVDQMDNDASFRRQSTVDTTKAPRELQSEQPLEAAVLFTLSGVNAIMTNQWATSFHANARLVNRLFDSLIKNKQELGESVKAATSAPVLVPKPEFVGAGNIASVARTSLKRNSKGDLGMMALQVKTRVACNTVMYGLPSFVMV